MNYSPRRSRSSIATEKSPASRSRNIEEHRQEQGAFGFVGVDDHYFLSAVVPPAEPLQVELQPDGRAGARARRPALQFISWSVQLAVVDRQRAISSSGRKISTFCRASSRDLVRAIDFGMFDWLVVPLLRALKWVNGYIGNYGWSIIALTVLINLAMFPLRHKSVVSMRKMQELQPEMKAIQDRYAKLKMTDPARQKMNEEVMALYSGTATNPASRLRADAADAARADRVLRHAGGRHRTARRAVYRVDQGPLGRTIRVRDAGPDGPHAVRPDEDDADVGRSGAAEDDAVHAADLLGMLMWAPSGLVLYWTASNLWAIGQQVVTNRLIGPPPRAQGRGRRPSDE